MPTEKALLELDDRKRVSLGRFFSSGTKHVLAWRDDAGRVIIEAAVAVPSFAARVQADPELRAEIEASLDESTQAFVPRERRPARRGKAATRSGQSAAASS